MTGIGRIARRYGHSVGVAIAALAAFAAPSAAAVPSPAAAAFTEVIPGQSIGPARLGMTLNAAQAALGPSMSIGRARRLYPRYGLVLESDGGVAARIVTTSVRYRTRAGAGVGTSAQDAARLIGDENSVTTASGRDTTVVYAFQGVGFVFREGRAVETFVLASIPFGPPKQSTIVPVSPVGPPIPVPSGPASGAGLPTSAPTGSGGAASGSPAVALHDVTANILSVGGLAVSGTAANIGAVPIGPLVVTATFTRASGDQVDGRTTIEGQLAPGGSAPFTVQAAMVADVIIRYQVSVTSGTGASLVVMPAEAVSPTAYATFAQRQIHVRVDLGAPSQLTGPPRVQTLVSVADTGAIPAAWVRQITVSVPYVNNGEAGSATVQLAPGETQTVLVPAGATLGAPVVTGVVLSGQ
jgi:hypothetical protein